MTFPLSEGEEKWCHRTYAVSYGYVVSRGPCQIRIRVQLRSSYVIPSGAESLPFGFALGKL
jgi:hypothetical protein